MEFQDTRDRKETVESQEIASVEIMERRETKDHEESVEPTDRQETKVKLFTMRLENKDLKESPVILVLLDLQDQLGLLEIRDLRVTKDRMDTKVRRAPKDSLDLQETPFLVLQERKVPKASQETQDNLVNLDQPDHWVTLESLDLLARRETLDLKETQVDRDCVA